MGCYHHLPCTCPHLFADNFSSHGHMSHHIVTETGLLRPLLGPLIAQLWLCILLQCDRRAVLEEILWHRMLKACLQCCLWHLWLHSIRALCLDCCFRCHPAHSFPGMRPLLRPRFRCGNWSAMRSIILVKRALQVMILQILPAKLWVTGATMSRLLPSQLSNISL